MYTEDPAMMDVRLNNDFDITINNAHHTTGFVNYNNYAQTESSFSQFQTARAWNVLRWRTQRTTPEETEDMNETDPVTENFNTFPTANHLIDGITLTMPSKPI